MNRIHAAAQRDTFLKPGPSNSARKPSAKCWRFTFAGRQAPLAVFTPLHYEPNYAYPLVIWLHGGGEDETQLNRLIPLVSLRNYVAVGIRGSARRVCQGEADGYGWTQSPAHVSAAEEQVLRAIAVAQSRFHIADRRIFIAGFDSGGTMSFRLGLRHPRKFAGVLSLLGEFPQSGRPLSRLEESRRLPLFVATGRQSEVYPPPAASRDLRLFHAAGLAVTLREYSCGHCMVPQMLSDMDHWLMARVTGQEPSFAGEVDA
jgi:phospholipase/carboxylesterase